MSDRFDLTVIGGGPGGYAAALYGASAGLKVAIVEESLIGGVCLHRGCIPAKQFLEAASVARTVGRADEFGVDASGGEIDWARLVKRKDRTVETIYKGLKSLVESRSIVVYPGRGRLLSPGRVEIVGESSATEVVESAGVVLATGSRPRSLPGLEFGPRVISSDEAFSLESKPDRVAIVGGGAIGVEFASFFTDIGVEVHLLEALDSLLPGADAEISDVLRRALRRRGVKITTSAVVEGVVESAESTVTIAYTERGQSHRVEVDLVLVAVGREPVTEGIGLGEVGVERSSGGHIRVDPETLETGVAGIWAVGDVIETPQLAHVAYAEAMVAVRSFVKESPSPVDYSRVPWAIYSHPEVAFCGMSEEAARRELGGDRVVVSRRPFAAVGRANIIGEREGMAKVIAERGGAILGVHIVGLWASELLAPGYLATNWEASADEVAAFIQPHPTLSEAFGEAVQSITGRSIYG